MVYQIPAPKRHSEVSTALSALLLACAMLPTGTAQLLGQEGATERAGVSYHTDLHHARPYMVGQSYFMATHSFNVFVGPDRRTGAPGPLDLLAQEALLGERHRSAGIQMIGGSTPMQHWNQGDGNDTENVAKVALRNGGIDVMTISPNAVIPEEGIDLFAELLMETNPTARLLVQHSWSPWDGNGSTPGVGGTGDADFDLEDHDRADMETIQGWIDEAHAPGGYLERLRRQLGSINQSSGHDMAFVVPVADAVYRLRLEVLKGNVPGIQRQSELFVDGMGHPAQPIMNLATYVWFTVMYRQPPWGLTALMDPRDPTSAAREEFLQEIAWGIATAEPMAGLWMELLWPKERLPRGNHGDHDGHVDVGM